jgi:hypothetical protein
MSRPIAYYGGDTTDNIDDKLEEMLVELAAMADPEVDFSQLADNRFPLRRRTGSRLSWDRPQNRSGPLL